MSFERSRGDPLSGLADSPLFSGLSELELDAVSAFLELRLYARGALVFREGDPGQEMFVVRSGKVGSCVKQADGTVRKIYEFGQGRFFGEMAIVEGAPRSATCWAEDDAELLVLHGIDFFRLVFVHPVIGHKLLSAIGKVMVGWLDESSSFLNDLVRWGETARRRAVEDTLTGLFNRRFLEDSLQTRCSALSAGGREVSLLMMDLDRIHEVNEAHGTEGGDAAIRLIGAGLRGALKDGEVAARLAGDEFAVLLPDAGYSDALARAEAIRSRIAELPIALAPSGNRPGAELRLTMSLGVATAPVHAFSRERLMAVADQALARAKEGGRNRVAGAGGA